MVPLLTVSSSPQYSSNTAEEGLITIATRGYSVVANVEGKGSILSCRSMSSLVTCLV